MDQKTKPKPGEIIIVKVGDKPYETVIDKDGTQRFRANSLVRHLCDSGRVDLNQLCIDYQQGRFTQEEYLHFNMGLGYSVCGLAELSSFEDLEIDNPLWE
jgi:hypothetical protein